MQQAMPRIVLGLLAASPCSLQAAESGQLRSTVQSRANPIRKVVTLLQDMQTKVTEEGRKQADLYEKFECYCKNGNSDLSDSIASATKQIESLTASLKEASEKKVQTEADLKEHTTSRNEAKDTMEKATAMRKKEAAEFAKFKADSEANLGALSKAITAIEKGVAGGFLQTNEAMLVKRFAMESADLPDATREEILSFLSGSQSQGYVPQSGEITGILKTMDDEMTKGLNDATATETAAIQNYEELMAAKKKEFATLQAQIEKEMTRIGNLGVSIASMSNDKEDTEEALKADQGYFAELGASCATKAKEWAIMQKTRQEELLAIAETIKVLNDDDALELFKKTLPSASSSLVQIQYSRVAVQKRVLSMLSGLKRPELNLIALALQGKKVGFDKVIKMIDEMVVNLKEEQKDDDHKREYCNAQIDRTEDKKKQLGNSISDSQTAIDEMTGAIDELAQDIAALEAGIKKLDKAVVEATDLRQKENAEHKELMSSDTTAKEVLSWAKNRLNKFYNPKLYKPPPERQMTEEERISVNMGGTLAPVTPGGIANTGIGAFVQINAHTFKAAPPPPPATFGAYTSKSGESNGVIAMVDLLIADLDKEMQQSSVDEKNAQEEYESMMNDSAVKRAADSKSVTQKTQEKATTEEELEDERETKKATTKELMGASKYLGSLHGECDWLLKYYDARKQARAGEVDSLTNAKSVLNGADYSML